MEKKKSDTEVLDLEKKNDKIVLERGDGLLRVIR